MVPKVHVLLTVRFTAKYPGEFPKFRGMSGSPGAGRRLKFPNFVQSTLAGFAGPLQGTPAAAKAGRSENWPSPFVSAPVIMLKGPPEEARMNGFKLTPHQGRLQVPPNAKRWRISKIARPYSP